MSDISMCSGKDCPLKKKCYRYTAPQSDYQSWFNNPPIKDNECDYFWDNKGYNKLEKDEV
jgi:hypothetical protein